MIPRLSCVFAVLFSIFPAAVSAQITLVTPAAGTATASSSPQTAEVDIKPSQSWVDTGIAVKGGDSITITATGKVTYGTASAGPEGVPRGFRDLLRKSPMNDTNRGALIGRIGEGDVAFPFLVGPSRTITAVRAGHLFLSFNQASNDVADGSFHAVVNVTAGAPKTAAANLNLPEVPQALLDGLPRRVQDAEGTPGDTVNFLIVGSEQRVLAAFAAAGWVKVDRSNKDAVLHGVLASISKQAYLEMPMSSLQLFGRPQDYGMAHAEPFSVVATRHHFRIWKGPSEVGGQTLWVGAGTHDIGFDRDQRNNGITHKIDPNIDLERQFILDSLTETGMVAKSALMTPAGSITKAKTAHGEEYSSDGRTLVVWLDPSSGQDTTLAPKFASMFCTVLANENPDGGTWKGCEQYIDVSKPQSLASLPDIPMGYRLLVVPGIMNSCASSAPAFEEGRVHLKDKHNFVMELLSVPNDSSEANAKAIAQYLKDQTANDPRKYILIGYSKGAPDIQTMLATNPDIVPKVAAFVSVAGASGGSPIADILPAQMDALMKKANFGPCKGDLSTGFKSLRRDARAAFLARYPKPFVPTYSLPATSDLGNTSKLLAENLKLMAVYGALNDSQLTAPDATIPGSKFLGTAKADHFAVALPLEKMNDGALKALVDKGSYPRGALLETILRLVGEDIGPASASAISVGNQKTATPPPSTFDLRQ
jgi:hypothetical protein